jgi:HK97 family phage major capsid protein
LLGQDGVLRVGPRELLHRGYGHGGQYSVLGLTQWILQDSVAELENFIVRQISAESALSVEDAVISGDGVNKPSGLLKNAPVATSDEAGSRAYQTLQSSRAAMPAQFRIRRQLRAAVMC